MKKRKNSHLSPHVMARTVQLLRYDAHSPTKLSYKAEIRAVDNQSDLRILL